MAEQNNTTCAICGKGYYLCLACKSNKLTPWKLHTDTSEHYKIFQILRGVFMNVYSMEEAKEKLSAINLSDIDTFNDDIKIRINEILNYQPENVKTIENVEYSNAEKTSVVKKTTRRKKSTQAQVVETE